MAKTQTSHSLGFDAQQFELGPESPSISGYRVSVLSEWLEVRLSVGNRYLFLNARGRSMSRDGSAYRLNLHVAAAVRAVPSLAAKRVTPHVLRHSTAMTILQATGDISKVSWWLGHADTKTTELYLRVAPVAAGLTRIPAPPAGCSRLPRGSSAGSRGPARAQWMVLSQQRRAEPPLGRRSHLPQPHLAEFLQRPQERQNQCSG